MKKKDKLKSSVTDLLTDIEKKKVKETNGDTGDNLLTDDPFDMFKKYGVTEIVKGSKKFKI